MSHGVCGVICCCNTPDEAQLAQVQILGDWYDTFVFDALASLSSKAASSSNLLWSEDCAYFNMSWHPRKFRWYRFNERYFAICRIQNKNQFRHLLWANFVRWLILTKVCWPASECLLDFECRFSFGLVRDVRITSWNRRPKLIFVIADCPHDSDQRFGIYSTYLSTSGSVRVFAGRNILGPPAPTKPKTGQRTPKFAYCRFRIYETTMRSPDQIEPIF